MRPMIDVSFFSTSVCALAILVVTSSLDGQMVGQNAGPESGGAVGTEGIARITGTRSPWGAPATTNGNVGASDQTRHVFLSGNVVFEDGASPVLSIRIERVCGSSVSSEGHADSKGRFSFQLGGEVASSIAEADSSNNNLGSARNGTDGVSQSAGGSDGVTQGLMGCQLRASYPGYVSDSIDLSTHHPASNIRVGTIFLRRLADVQGTTVSVTTAQAPKAARTSFEKGFLLVQKGKFEEAEVKFKLATAADADFAVAWFALGQVQHRLNKPDEAAKSYLAAVAADSRYVSPYDQLALLCGEQGKWQEAAQYSKAAINLNPVEFPSSFWYNALANYNLKNDAEAEKSAQTLVKMDLRHRFPQAETMLAEFAESHGDLLEAATHLRAFLLEAPAASNADAVKKQLARIEAGASTSARK